ncbi:hypothetical protein CEXT_400361 [Caerostris extrusa]|uniref:Uncharacterized protein n=1 Tax=Caerostris extrusa TaxID=172846 RepID=A0AAV4Q9W1_CAEEX|nr:hypothetical protein CEXT_400361 [Caerostris extrusa]
MKFTFSNKDVSRCHRSIREVRIWRGSGFLNKSFSNDVKLNGVRVMPAIVLFASISPEMISENLPFRSETYVAIGSRYTNKSAAILMEFLGSPARHLHTYSKSHTVLSQQPLQTQDASTKASIDSESSPIIQRPVGQLASTLVAFGASSSNPGGGMDVWNAKGEDNEIIYKMEHTRATVGRAATKGVVRFRRRGIHSSSQDCLDRCEARISWNAALPLSHDLSVPHRQISPAIQQGFHT